jgi:hypothetical protein
MDGLEGFQLAMVLTAAGMVPAAALIAGVIGLLKNLGGLGAWIEAGHEPIVAYVLSALLVAAAYAAGSQTGEILLGIDTLFAAFMAWYGIVKISYGVHADVTARRSGTS